MAENHEPGKWDAVVCSGFAAVNVLSSTDVYKRQARGHGVRVHIALGSPADERGERPVGFGRAPLAIGDMF